MSVHTGAPDVQSRVPAPEFAVTGAAHLKYAAVPTMVFSVAVSDPARAAIQSMVVSAQVMIDPARRGYDAAARERLGELFGPPTSWTPSTQALQWARVTAVVPGFTDSTTFALDVPCSYDLEVAATKYFYALLDGEAPLSFHFSGTVFYRGLEGALQVVPVSWSASARFGLAVSAWKAMIAEHYPASGWIRLGEETLRALHERRAARGLPTFDACVRELLDAR